MQQLASFEPEDEAYFDEEVDNYRYVLLINIYYSIFLLRIKLTVICRN